jgi:hypothetical protein
VFDRLEEERAMTRMGVAVAMCVALPIIGEAQGPPVVRRESSKWVLTVRSAERYANQPHDQAGYWLGVKNLGATAEAICVLSLDYGIVDPQHGTGGMLDGPCSRPSPHACRTPAGSNLILPGESIVFYVSIEVPAWAGPGSELMFSASLKELATGEWLTLPVGGSLPAAGGK